MEPIQKNTQVILLTKKLSIESKNNFHIGVNKYIQNNILIIEIYENWFKYLPFILLREIYNLFVPSELRDYESLQLVINQILMVDLSKHQLINEWKSLIRENLEQYDFISLGFDRLSEFDRLDQFFMILGKKTSNTPTEFFLKYLRENISLIQERIEYIHEIFYRDYENYIFKSMINDEKIETIRCLVEIFYKVKNYKNLLSYKQYFQKFKETGFLNTTLSLRKFIKNMEWIKNDFILAPSYQLNWKTINVNLISFYVRFNPTLNKNKIYRIIDNFPFFTTPKFAFNSFALDLLGYIVIPKEYLDDFLKFMEKLKNYGYIIKYYCLEINKANFNKNLNYFREYSQKQQIINPNHQNYNKKYELEFRMDYGKKFYHNKLNLLSFLTLDRIRFTSASGLGFERRVENLNLLKSDLLNYVITQRSIIKNLKNSLTFFHFSSELKKEFLEFLDINRNFGFFYVKSFLEQFLILANRLSKILKNNLNIKNITLYKSLVKHQNISHLIEENILFNNNQLKQQINKTLLPIYFKSKNQFDKVIEKYNKYYELINSCYNLKIFSLKSIQEIIEDKLLIETILKKKDKKFKDFYSKYKLYKIKSQEIDRILEKFLSHQPRVIKPNLLNSIRDLYMKDFLEIIIIDSQRNHEILQELKKYFSTSLIVQTIDTISKNNLLYVELSAPDLTLTEKRDLYSTLCHKFNNEIIFGKSFMWSGNVEALSSKSFYDFEHKEFFYTKDLFDQFFNYVYKNFGAQVDIPEDREYKLRDIFWLNEKNISNLVNKINSRFVREKFEFNIKSLNILLNFHFKLLDNLLDRQKFKEKKQDDYFRNHIKSIKFIPAFENFGLGQYFLYLYPTDMNEIDFRLLLINTFQKVKYPACIDDSYSLFIKFVMPYNTPNLKYLNWLIKAKKIIREYCVYFIKKVYHIFHFNYNLNPEGWSYDKDRFKIYMQNILFNPNYKAQLSNIKEFEIANKSVSSYLGPESPEYDSLTRIYDWKSIDIKSYLATQKHSVVNHIITLLKKNLIFPYLSLKNLDLHDKFYIILPNVKQELNKTLLKIFSFFNYGFIFEIEGEYFIYGFPKEVKFENGLMIKLYLPKCELHEFIKLFDLLFEYLEIKDYLILNDLVDGSQLIKSIYGSLDFLKEYNPLKNLKWNSKDKRWMNHKLFTQKFEPIYPDLLSKG